MSERRIHQQYRPFEPAVSGGENQRLSSFKTLTGFKTLLGLLGFIKQRMAMEHNLLVLEEEIVKMLKTVYDPEIPVNIYDLGLIYGVEADDDKNVLITMTLTAPACPAADFIIEDVRMKIESIAGVKSVNVDLVFEPEWHKDMMSEEAKLELGFL
jgi:FeS assembly SUF system protein